MHPLCSMYCVRVAVRRAVYAKGYFEYFSVLLITSLSAAFSQKPMPIAPVFKNRLNIHSFSFHSKSDLSKEEKKNAFGPKLAQETQQ